MTDEAKMNPLEELQRLSDAATKGAYRALGDGSAVWSDSVDECVASMEDDDGPPDKKATAAFLARSANLVRALLPVLLLAEREETLQRAIDICEREFHPITTRLLKEMQHGLTTALSTPQTSQPEERRI